MKMVKMAASLLAAGAMATAHAQPSTLSENFDDVAGLAAQGWIFTNLSSPAGQNWFQGNEGIFSAQAGAAGAYAAVNFNSTSSNSGAIDNWLISPEISFSEGATLSFYTRASDMGFLDQLQVLVSSGSGSSTAGFTTTLGMVGSSASASYPSDDWMLVSYALPTTGTGRIAFRYAVGNALDASYVGLDTLSVTAVPEPASALLLGLGLTGLIGFVSRRRNSR